MDYENEYDGIDENVVTLIKKKVRKLIRQGVFSESDRDDLEQELIFELHLRTLGYRSKRASVNEFVINVIERKIARLLEARNRHVCDYRSSDLSISGGFEDDEGSLDQSADRSASTNHLPHEDVQSRSTEDLCTVVYDVAKVIGTLPRELRELCFRLQTESVAEISCETGWRCDKICESINQLREIFEYAGLRGYL